MCNNTSNVEMHVNNFNTTQKIEQAKIQNVAPVCIIFNI